MGRETKTEMNFEKALARLEQIVELMESGEVELDKMIEMFEEGQRLTKACSDKLDEVEKRIEKMTANADGSVSTTPFEVQGE